MNKREWEDGEFKSCNHLYAFKDTIRIAWIYCPYCGADIRKPEPKTPSHQEIMTLWWKTGLRWKKVIQYDTDGEGWYYLYDERTAVSKLWFVNMESAAIPPEKE